MNGFCTVAIIIIMLVQIELHHEMSFSVQHGSTDAYILPNSQLLFITRSTPLIMEADSVIGVHL